MAKKNNKKSGKKPAVIKKLGRSAARKVKGRGWDVGSGTKALA